MDSGNQRASHQHLPCSPSFPFLKQAVEIAGAQIDERIHRGLDLSADNIQLFGAEVLINMDGRPVKKNYARERIRNLESIPGRKNFFFSLTTTAGMIGLPLFWAASTTPI